MKSAALAVSVLSFAGVVLAQSTTTSGSASATTSANASSGTRSAQCNQFLSQLDSDRDVSSCLNALIGATSDFDPSNTANTSSAAITAALDKICPSTFIACDESKIRLTLFNFYTQCHDELLGANGLGTDGYKDVVDTYDVLYLLIPLKNAVCSRDLDGKYCVNKMATPTSASTSRTATGSSTSSSASSSATHARRYIEPYKRELVARAPGDGTNSTSGQLTLGGLGQQSTQMNNDGLPYLFMTNTTSDAELCTNCTAQVVGAYVAFENATPYALGLARSPILSGQIKLWQRLKSCNGGQLVRDILSANIGTSSQYNSAFTGASVNTWLAGGAALLFGAIALF